MTQQIIKDLYEYFYLKLYAKNKKYTFQPSEKATLQINKFISFLDERYGVDSIGIGYLWSYFVYQFIYWHKLELEAFYGKMQIQNIVGEKAFKRWLARNVDFDFKLNKNDLGVSRIEFTEIYIEKKKLPKVIKSEEIQKKLFFNTDRGFLVCIENTSLYNSGSKLCLTCIFKDKCKALLMENYPSIYNNRYGAATNR